MIAILTANLRFIVAALGLALVAYGCSLAWLPLAFIVPGTLLVIVAVGGALVEARRVPEDRRVRR